MPAKKRPARRKIKGTPVQGVVHAITINGAVAPDTSIQLYAVIRTREEDVGVRAGAGAKTDDLMAWGGRLLAGYLDWRKYGKNREIRVFYDEESEEILDVTFPAP